MDELVRERKMCTQYFVFSIQELRFCDLKVRLIGLGLRRRTCASVICGGCVMRLHGEIRSYNWKRRVFVRV